MRIVILCQEIRSATEQPILINNWFNGGDLKERCIREPDSTTGAAKSRHKYLKSASGKINKKCDAVDIKIGDMSTADMHAWAKTNRQKLYNLGVRCIETESLTPTWMHLDLRYVGTPGIIQIVDLTKVVDIWTC